MKAAIVVLAPSVIQNRVRQIVVQLNANYQTEFYAALLPSHVSLKQPFEFENMDALERYFDGLAAHTAPFEIQLERYYYEEWAGMGILGLRVLESPALRGLHNQINAELSEIFKDTRAPHDGADYRFHLTIELGRIGGVNGFEAYFKSLPDPQLNLSFTAKELALFYYTDDANRPGTFINYRVQPLK